MYPSIRTCEVIRDWDRLFLHVSSAKTVQSVTVLSAFIPPQMRIAAGKQQSG